MKPGSVGILKLRADDISWREVEDQVLVLHLNRGVYLSLNGSARILWLALVDGTSAEEMSQLLVDAYGIAAKQAQSDVSNFVADLVERDLVEQVS